MGPNNVENGNSYRSAPDESVAPHPIRSLQQVEIRTTTQDQAFSPAIPDFVPDGFIIDPTDPKHIRSVKARVGSALMEGASPLFLETEVWQDPTSVPVTKRPTSLELYLVGESDGEMDLSSVWKDRVRELANMGVWDIRGIERNIGTTGRFSGGDFVGARTESVLEGGRISRLRGDQRRIDLSIIVYEDISAATIVARLRGGMSKQADSIRKGTHELIGDDPSTWYRVNPVVQETDPETHKNKPEVTIIVPADPRDFRGYGIEKRVSLQEIVKSLSLAEQRGYFHMVRLFTGALRGPHARAVAQQLRGLHREIGYY